MAELADAPDSKSGSRKRVGVRPSLRAPKNPLFFGTYDLKGNWKNEVFTKLVALAFKALDRARAVDYSWSP